MHNYNEQEKIKEFSSKLIWQVLKGHIVNREEYYKPLYALSTHMFPGIKFNGFQLKAVSELMGYFLQQQEQIPEIQKFQTTEAVEGCFGKTLPVTTVAFCYEDNWIESWKALKSAQVTKGRIFKNTIGG